MSFTNPNDYPVRGGVDPRDENHDIMPKKPSFKVFLKPLTLKIIEKNLFIEVFGILLVSIIGIGEIIGRQLSSGLYFALGCVITVLVVKFLHIEDETHTKAVVSPALTSNKNDDVGTGSK